VEEIQVRLGVPSAAAARDVVAGRADVATGLTPRTDPGSGGGLRSLGQPTPGLRSLFVNPRRSLLRSARLRRAIALALDRPALAELAGPLPNAAMFAPAGLPTDQFVPQVYPGFRDVDAAPLDGPDVARARRLVGKRRHQATLWTCDVIPCPQRAAILAANLRAVGIELRVRPMPTSVLARRVTGPGAYDLATAGWIADYAIPPSSRR